MQASFVIMDKCGKPTALLSLKLYKRREDFPYHRGLLMSWKSFLPVDTSLIKILLLFYVYSDNNITNAKQLVHGFVDFVSLAWYIL